MQKYIVLDLETTGLDPRKDRIIEVAAILCDTNGKTHDTYHTLINPERPISEEITNITTIDDEMVADAPIFSNVIGPLQEFIGDHIIVGHNIAFDISFLRAAGVVFSDKSLDTWILSTILQPHLPSHSLEALVRSLKLPLHDAHRALGDVHSTYDLFLHLLKSISDLPDKTHYTLRKGLAQQSGTLIDFFNGQLRDIDKQKLADNTKKPQKNSSASSLTLSSDFTPGAIEDHFDALGKEQSKTLEHIELRPSQSAMSKTIAHALLHDEFQLIEAGTGLGKSFAYLLPAMYFSQNVETPVIVSTHTLHLQDQIANSDIPFLQSVLPFPVSVLVLKGRSHYLCTKRFEEFYSTKHTRPFSQSLLIKLLLWVQTTSTGDLSTLRQVRQEYGLLQTLTCSPHNCHGMQCKGSGDLPCFYKESRKKAQSADILIVNHALLVSDQLLGSDALPFHHLIVDEAHQLESSLQSYYQKKYSMKYFDDYFRTIKDRLSHYKDLSKPALARAKMLLQETDEQTALFFGLVSLYFRNEQQSQGFRESTRTISHDARADHEWKQLAQALSSLIAKFERFFTELHEIADDSSIHNLSPSQLDQFSSDIDRFFQQWNEVKQDFQEFFSSPVETKVYWLEQRMRPVEELSLFLSPIDVHNELHDLLLSQLSSCIFTSATLRVAGEFSHIRERLHLGEEFDEHVFDSPFDYASQAALVLPTQIPAPSDPSYPKELYNIIMHAADAFEGRTMVLFTSHAAVRQAYDALFKKLQKKDIALYAQGRSGGRQKILEMFRHQSKSMLFGTQSFWEGVDIKGQSLTCLIIAKLPFPVPSDPLLSEQSKTYDNPFMELMIPKTVLSLQQGFGRLIRGSYDTGVVVLADQRVQTKAYGALFLESLPPAHVHYLSREEIGPFFKAVDKM